ncbi:hypothetical protein PFNF135_06178, partial [Plasmodium falciparum NF135/5.C10]
MGPQRATQDESAKHMFDRIGKIVHEKAKNDALSYNNALKGILSNTIFSNNEKLDNSDVCQFDHTKHTNVTSGKSHPCYGRQGVRFSDTNGAECYRTRIKGSKDNTIGACAPFRRLHMCDRNLEEIYPDKIKKTENLLVDVLLAAKHEGEMITKNLKEYDNANYESKICTALARSFADIGDIIRGKDHFLGHNQRKKKLEERLEQMFKNIQGKYPTLTGLPLDKVREYWWEANRNQVWKAITCNAPEKAEYFRNTCAGEQRTPTHKQCRCAAGDVPTYFDYVPQFLRWFEEWTEEFCRKKKKYVNIVKKYCRDETKGKYCSLNGHDCTDTIRAIGRLRMGNDCTKCLHACSHYRGWLANQKKEFEKQKEKYKNEIIVSNPQKKGTSDIGNNEYDKKFYEKLKTYYGNVDKFLELLNQEKECKVITKEEGNINFPKNDYNETFYRSEYCELCPECGVHCEPGKCTPRGNNHVRCIKEERKRTKEPKITDIEFLFNDKEGDDIVKKLNAFYYSKSRDNKDKGIEVWKCSHYDDNDNECVTKNNGKDVKGDTKTMPFVDFFEFWVTHLLNDAIEWRKEINKCLNNNPLTKCNNRCNRYCKFFTKWVEQKKKEWGKIKEHFDKQDELFGKHHFTILETLLENEFYDQIKEAYGDVKSIEKIKELLNNELMKEDDEIQNKEDIIQKLLEHDLDDANKCRETHNDKNCQDTSGGRSITNEDDDSEDEEHEKPPERDNPCAEPNGSNTKHPAIVNQVTHAIQEDTHAEAGKRGLSKLKGNALEGKYLGSGKEHKLKNICSITEDHSNCTNRSKKPCDGKDSKSDMFDITKGWKNGEFVNKTHTDTYMPPRRQHFCTSNLEHLNRNSKGLTGANASDSLLGDVLLSAKSEAKFIIDKYRNAPAAFQDEETICRALRYSFADLGDIIKGTDLWDEDNGEKTTQGHLNEIFHNIYNKNPDIQKIYKKIEHQKHLHLREDWWEANRKDVWRAMQCELKNLKKSNGDCHYNSRGTPLDDYIPQRLRWLTEWAEWYCKMQKKEYENLVKQCRTCTRGTCTGDSGDKNCDQCKAACTSYREKIKQWEKQWKQIELKYLILYQQAQTDARNVGRSVYVGFEKDKHFLKFFNELRKENNGKKTYETAEGYVHQEVPHMECQVQKQFCKHKNGGTTPTGTQEDDDYTFRENPKDHDGKCSCDKPQEKKFEVCNLVKEHFMLRNPQSGEIDGCNRKNSTNKWDCSQGSMNSENNGACMPPRRKALCIHNLTFNGETGKENGLRDALIKCSAKETYFLWEKYKNNKNEADTQLKTGTIPEEFKRM